MKKRGKVRIGQQLWACRDEGGIESLQLIFPGNSSKIPSTVGYDTHTPLSYETFEIQQFENFLLNFSSCQGSSKEISRGENFFFFFAGRWLRMIQTYLNFVYYVIKWKRKRLFNKKKPVVCGIWTNTRKSETKWRLEIFKCNFPSYYT